MRSGVIILPFLLLPAWAGAEVSCETISSLAQATMEARQKGVLASDLIKKTESSRNPDMKEMARQLVITAYERPRHYSRSMQERAATDFANEAWVLCEQALE